MLLKRGFAREILHDYTYSNPNCKHEVADEVKHRRHAVTRPDTPRPSGQEETNRHQINVFRDKSPGSAAKLYIN